MKKFLFLFAMVLCLTSCIDGFMFEPAPPVVVVSPRPVYTPVIIHRVPTPQRPVGPGFRR